MEKLTIKGIPALLFGKPSESVYIFVHGKLSKKEYAESFAVIAARYGFQVLAFDLPSHGERAEKNERCDIWNGMRDCNIIADYAFDRWQSVSLYACSLGTFFSLNAYADRHFDSCLFASPIADMKELIENMMRWSNVSKEELQEKGEIDTPIDLLSWRYYTYVLEHPIEKWTPPTHILYGALDNLQTKDAIERFAEKFGAELTVCPDTEHPFMAEGDGEKVEKWIIKSLVPAKK